MQLKKIIIIRNKGIKQKIIIRNYDYWGEKQLIIEKNILIFKE